MKILRTADYADGKTELLLGRMMDSACSMGKWQALWG